MPVSYFWICWNLIPTRSANCCWVMPTIQRRCRTRLPTCTSTGCFITVSNHSVHNINRERLFPFNHNLSFWPVAQPDEILFIFSFLATGDPAALCDLADSYPLRNTRIACFAYRELHFGNRLLGYWSGYLSSCMSGKAALFVAPRLAPFQGSVSACGRSMPVHAKCHVASRSHPAARRR